MVQFAHIQEIVDPIVDHLVDIIQAPKRDYLDELRLPELEQTALINKAFASRSQKYLFSLIYLNKVYFQVDPGQIWDAQLDEMALRTVLNLLEIFKYKPHLAAHLRTIKLCVHFGNLVKRYEPVSRLLTVLKNYRNPRHINIMINALDYRDPVPEPDYSYLTHLRLQSLTFSSSYIKLPATFFVNHPELQSLNLKSCRWKPDDVSPSTLTTRPAIKRLTFEDCNMLLRYLFEPGSEDGSLMDFSSLEYLCIPSPSGETRVLIQQLISISAQTLKEFTSHASLYEADFDFSACANLRIADLRLAHASIETLVTTIGTIPSPNLIEVLNIQVAIQITGNKPGERLQVAPPWEVLDRELYRALSASRWAKVAARLHVKLWRHSDDMRGVSIPETVEECDQYMDNLPHLFPLTSSDEGINFSITREVILHFHDFLPPL
ncbi:hypothetical protein BJ165DRAFT_1001515 [Panaeolus papilionaceus]|nr:hypothetical protein BJ165DRAFT_1001515 [Panaeolus papilionaceus]